MNKKVMESFGLWQWFGEGERRIEKRSYKHPNGREYGRTELYYKVTCSCEARVIKWIPFQRLKRGSSKSCGCLAKKLASDRFKNRPKVKLRRWHPLYNVWSGMNQRCNRPDATGWKHYGGRGIKVCDQWHRDHPNGFDNFCEYMGERPEDHSIDRINNDGNYEPGNVRWVTMKDNLLNRREVSKYRQTALTEDPAVFGNWIFNGDVERKYDNRGISNRYYKVVCKLCGSHESVRKQDITQGKSTKCRSCSHKDKGKS
jgi:hypothetical protein